MAPNSTSTSERTEKLGRVSFRDEEVRKWRGRRLSWDDDGGGGFDFASHQQDQTERVGPGRIVVRRSRVTRPSSRAGRRSCRARRGVRNTGSPGSSREPDFDDIALAGARS
jgi:hypothetical protein